MPRVRSFDKEEALRKAMELFWEKGYASTSLQDLTEHLGIGKGSFYATFGSKEDLFAATLELYKKSRREQLMALLQSESDIRQGLRNLMKFNLEEMLQHDNGKGCFVSNTSTEYTRFNDIFKEQFVQHFQDLRNELTAYLIAGNVVPEKAQSIVASVITFLIGMSHQTKFDRNKKQYLNSIDDLVSLLD